MKRTSLLPKEAMALVHHVELNRSGWWERAVHHLVLAAVWVAEAPPTVGEIEGILKNNFQLSLNISRISSVVDKLESQETLLRLPHGHFRIPDNKRAEFEKEIGDAEKVEQETTEYFYNLANTFVPNLDAKALWASFEADFLGPLIQEVGANTYHLIAGERLSLQQSQIERFTDKFAEELKPKLAELVSEFLNPKKAQVRFYISRMLHASFCVQASGLSESVIKKLNEASGKQIRFRIFVDTNFLFSILALHENPSNAAASELQDLISQLKTNPKVELLITPPTVEEAKSSISSAKYQVIGIPTGGNFTNAALHIGFSGMVSRFFSERQRKSGSLSAEDWFDPYLSDFVRFARDKGVELFNEKLDAYSMRQDVIDDINAVLVHEMKLPADRRKSYEKIKHDMMLWHFVNDKRLAYIESPLDAVEWILTVDFRLIGFDNYKQSLSGSKVPLCLHPASLIQLLQFWVPRTAEFEEAMLGSLRLPFLFREFDIDAERTSLRILKGLGRFEGRDDISSETITDVILNDGLRSRLKPEQSEDEEVGLIRDALIEEIKNKADIEAKKAQELHLALTGEKEALAKLTEEKEAKDKEIEDLRKKRIEDELHSKAAAEKIAQQESELGALKLNQKQRDDADILRQTKANEDEEKRKNNYYLAVYIVTVAVLLVISCFLGWVSGRFLSITRILGAWETSILIGLVTFITSHLVFEVLVRNNDRMHRIWPFKKITEFRKFLWSFIFLSFFTGVIGNIYASFIQTNLDNNQKHATPLAPIASTTNQPPQ